jgi:hypothetical protein
MTMTADSPQYALDPSVPRTVTGRRKIAILGYTWTVAEAPFDDPEWEIHSINDLFTLIRPGNVDMPAVVGAGKVHVWHHLHDAKTILENPATRPFLQEDHGFPVYFFPGVAERLGFDVPNARVFPKDDLVAKFGTYFTNTISWLMAMAIDQLAGVEGAEIGIYGVDMAVSGEFTSQRPSCEYFIGLATGLGIPVHIPETSDLLKAAALYGETHPMQAKLEQRVKELRSRQEQVAAVLQDHQFMHERIAGALEDAQHWLTVWFQPTNRDRDAGMNQPSDGIAPTMPPV